ncbi:MAG: hypothetical protein KatS3mg035_1122 [Bacteroidia bacterium]|nr:MAG: hypothetical protein KatS3mg035_1122 [Bacteroidia bacterium]
MSELLNSGKVGLTVFRNLAEQRQAIVRNWEDSGLLEGLKGMKKANTAQLLENQAQAMLNEVTLDSSAGRFDTVAFPIVRRVFSRLLANEIVSVQPLALPSGLLFYMDARVSFNGSDTTFNNPVYPNYPSAWNPNPGAPEYNKVAPANTANGQPGPNFADTSAYERFYNNRGFDLSFGTGYTVVGTTATNISGSSFTNGILAYTFTLGPDWNISTSQSSATLRFSAGTAIYYSGANGNTLLVPAGGRIPFYSQVQTWANDLYANQQAKVVLDLRPAGVYGSDFDANMLNDGTNFGSAFQISITPAYEIFNNLEAKSEMGEITIRFSSVTVNTETRKLRAHWTPELAQDLEAYHSIDAEAELTALLSEHIAAEIDREIIIDLINEAPFRARWDYKGLSNNANFFGTQKDWNQTLITRINELSAQIHKSTLRGGANWIVCSAEAGAIFDDLEYFHVDGSAQPESEKYNLGVEKIGNLGSRYVVYKDPYLPAPLVLLGHKGNTFLEAGYIYAPYIPLQLTQTIYDPNDFTPRKGIMTRYAKKMVNNRFYGVIYIDNINTY